MFRVELLHRTRLQKGRTVQGRLLEAVYSNNRIAIPSGALIEGTISELQPAPHSKRLDAKFHGDFTPLDEPVMQWTVLSRADGSNYPMQAESSANAGSTLYFRSNHTHESLIHRAWDGFVGKKNAATQTVMAPNKLERLQKFIWSQMPYHPQYLEEGTQYEIALTRDLNLPADSPFSLVNRNIHSMEGTTVTVHSRLVTDLTSAKAKAGDPVQAIVTQPVMNAQNELVIPQNSILQGRVLSAAPAGRWGKNGVLRFAFTEVTWPSGYRQTVEATPTAVEASPDAKLSVDDEGGVSHQTNRGVAAPLIMGLLSASAIGDEDGGVGKSAVASNGFAIVGRLAAVGIGSRYVGGSIGAVGTSRIVYTRFIAHGKETQFGSNTEVLLEVSPARLHRMTPVK